VFFFEDAKARPLKLSPAMTNLLKTPFRLTWMAVSVWAIFALLPCVEESGNLIAQENISRQELLLPYEQRVASVDEQHNQQMANMQQNVPPGFQPWWSQYVDRPLCESSRGLTINVEALVLGAMMHSPKVLALSAIPEIRKTEICEAEAIFDPRAFLESKFIRTSDPVSNFLVVGGGPRYRDQNWYMNGGIRRKTMMGGQLEASQRFGFEDNNSIYYFDTNIPVPQGSAKLALSYTQPLLNGAGRAYNESVIVLAAIDAGIASDQFAAELQNHLLEVNKAYWTLYLERVTYLQKKQLLQQAEDILNDLEARKRLDANGGQIVRARAAVESRRASLVRYEAAIHNAEAKINLLVNDPQLLSPDRAELIPIQSPHLQYLNLSVRDSLVTALHNRPEVNQSLQEIQAASVREKIACKDLLPVLDAVLAAYVSGLETDSRMDKSWIDQFYTGEPAYTAGLVYEMPLGNRSAKARLRKRQLELEQFSYQLKQTVAMVVEEIEVAVRDVDAAFRETQAQYLSMKAAESEIMYLESRWRLLPSEDQVAGIVLEDLLSAQERRGNAEIAFASAQIAYNISLANLNRATGTLLKYMPEPSPVDGGAPPKSDLEEIPSPPSDVVAPLPPTVSHAPAAAAGASVLNALYAQPQQQVGYNSSLAKVNGVSGIDVKSAIAPLPPVLGSSPKGETERLPPASGEVSAPLPPTVSHVPAASAGTSETQTITARPQPFVK
jgi:outer membrane protein TolC